jgi:Fe-S cluster biogenesis protein NfuA
VITKFDIEEVLAEKVVPSLAMHGGGIELLDYNTDTGNVHVRLMGSCAGCAASMITLKMGVENTLFYYFPGDIQTITHEEAEITNPFY